MVYKRTAGGSYFYRFKYDGRTYRVCTRQGNKKAAMELEASHRTRLAKGDAGLRDPREIPTLRAFAPQFLAGVTASAPTVKFYQQKLKDLLAYEPLAGARLNRIDENLLQQFIKHRREQIAYPSRQSEEKVSVGTVNHALRTIRHALHIAYELQLINRVPKVKLLPGERVRDYVLDQETEVQYLSAAPEPLKSLVLLLVDTGLRLGEALRLEWSDINLEQRYLQVRTGKSRNAARTFSLTTRVAAMLRERGQVVTDEFVFTNNNGKPYRGTYCDRLHQRVRESLKLPDEFVLHSLRHTFLTRLGATGADTFVIKKIAGHSSVVTSERYIHPVNEAVSRAMVKLDEMNQRGPSGAHQPVSPESEVAIKSSV